MDIKSFEYKNLVEKLIGKPVVFIPVQKVEKIQKEMEKDVPKTQCLKVASLRKKYGDENIDLEKWMAMPNNLYTGRRGRIFIGSGDEKRIFHYSDSKWGNPYIVPEYSLEESLKLYEIHVREKLLKDIQELEGKTLGCFCDQSQPCHTKILVKLFKEFYNI